jgi:hypothetical protein
LKHGFIGLSVIKGVLFFVRRLGKVDHLLDSSSAILDKVCFLLDRSNTILRKVDHHLLDCV